jgi:hypothetical protein
MIEAFQNFSEWFKGCSNKFLAIVEHWPNLVARLSNGIFCTGTGDLQRVKKRRIFPYLLDGVR